MDLVHGAKYYINKMVDDVGVGMKVLLMDKETVRVKQLTNICLKIFIVMFVT